MTSRRQLEAAWAKAKQPVKPNAKLPVLFDRQRRIHLLWEIFFVVGLILFVFCLIAGVR